MTRNSVYSCPNCNTMHTLVLDHASLLACRNCGEIIVANEGLPKKPIKAPLPEDWSFVQLGTTAEYSNQKLKIIGRIRYQLRNDYKNFWCADAGLGQFLWIVESFGSFAVFKPTREQYTKDAGKLRSGAIIPFSADVKLTGEYVEKCEGVNYQGEIGPWKLFNPGFFVIQASNASGFTVLYFINESRDSIEFITGQKTTPEQLKLNNIVTWNEWK